MNPSGHTFQDIQSICGGETVGEITRSFSTIVTDSRRLTRGSVSLFVALKGINHNGHDFIQSAYDAGVRAFLVSEQVNLSAYPGAGFHISTDTLRTWQSLVAHHRSTMQCPVIGITGSNGKTIVKEWLNQFLAGTHRIVRSPKSFNSQIGVPLSVWNMQPKHDLAIFEAGISQPDEMAKLAAIIAPTHGIFTNLRSAHMEHFESAQQLADEKAKLFSTCSEVICSINYPIALEALRRHAPNAEIVTWGTENATWNVQVLDRSASTQSVAVNVKGKTEIFGLPFADEASCENAIHCIIYLLQRGYHPDWIEEKIKFLAPIAMRLETLAGKNNCKIVSDVYSSDEQSLRIALDHLKQRGKGLPLSMIISDFDQSGMTKERQMSLVLKLIDQYELSHVVLVGPDLSQLIEHPKVTGFLSVEALLQSGHLDSIESSAVLVKGARRFAFERVLAAIQEKTHDTVFEIDMDALAYNLNAFRERLKPDVKLMVMVKAQGYGTGSVDIAQFLEFSRVDYLGVAFTDEGVELRNQGISLPIMVMNPERGSLDSLIDSRLEPEIYSFETLDRFIHHLANAEHAKKPYPIHLKIDTGMRRLGFEEGQIDELVARLNAHPEIEVASAFTHLAASDEAGKDGFTLRQLDHYRQAADRLQAGIGYGFVRHALNSAGILRFPEEQMDMVRLGIGLYGISAIDDLALKCVGRLKTIISQIKEVPAGESVGYGRAFVSNETTKIATIPVGYADGLFRSLGRGVGQVNIGGKLAPIVGNVCMDMCMIDVTGISCQPGDEVEVFGDNPSITDLAHAANTIPYEILASISSRVKRVYAKEEV